MTIETGSQPASPQRTQRWSFDDLKGSYNFRHQSNQADVFLDLLAEEAARHPGPVRALDVGCGRGMGTDPQKTLQVRALFDELWGIEPDTSVTPPAGAFTHFEHAAMEEADLPPASFDVLYSRMVMEHVQDPLPFMLAAHRALKPGGAYLFMTVNGRHYFARIARLLTAMRLDDIVLKLLLSKGKAGYHYPVAYRCNSTRDIARFCREVDFQAPEFVFIERRGPAPYMRGPLKPVLHLMNRKRDLARRPELLLEMICRTRKPAEPPTIITTAAARMPARLSATRP